MLAALLPLIPLLAGVAPHIAEWLGGDDAEAVANQVVGAVRSVVGAADEMAVAAAMADPEQRGRLAVELARIAAERERVREEAITARIAAALADTADARRQTVALAQQGSALAYGAALVSAVILALFAMMVGAEQFGWSPVSDGTKRLVEAALVLVLGYWVGSSAGSAAKDSRQGAVIAAAVGATAVANGELASTPRRLFGGEGGR